HTRATSTLSLHDALPIWDDQQEAGAARRRRRRCQRPRPGPTAAARRIEGSDRDEQEEALRVRRAEIKGGGEEREQPNRRGRRLRSEEHTSELQSQSNLVC